MKFKELFENWPNLKGSEKQIKYGDDCREKLWNWHIKKEKSSIQKVDEKAWNIIFSFIDDSKFFIENKDSSPRLFYMNFSQWLKNNGREGEFERFRKNFKG